MDTRAARLERHKLPTESSEHAYSDGIVVHTTHKSGLSEVWKREKEVGSGAFGTVWLEKSDAGELRAVKSLRRNFRIDFLREVQALAELRDYPEQFIHFSGWFEDREFIFIAMEYTECGDLRKYLKDSRPKARREVREIAGQVAEGLAVLHGKNICHRDLNPQNVLITSFLPICVKIADFGVSKKEIDTELHTQCGTPGYRAPEQQGFLPREYQVGRSYTNAADMWALGCLIHEILTSEIPFLLQDDTGSVYSDLDVGPVTQNRDMNLFYQYCNKQIKFPTQSLRKSIVGDGGVDFVERLLVIDPKSRTTASGALRNPWLAERNESEGFREQLSHLGVQLSLEDADCLVAQVDQISINEIFAPSGRDIDEIRHAAASNGYHLLFKSLSTADIDIRTQGVTSLQAAAEGGHVDVVKYILEQGADPNASPAYGGQTALQAAAEGGHIDVVKLLLGRGADASTPLTSSGGQTVLKAATESGLVDVVKLLLERNVDANTSPASHGGQIALQAAAEGGRVDLVKFLLDQGVDINVSPINNGQAILQAAAKGGHLEVVELLLKRGANVNAAPADDVGRTALQAAAKGGHLKVAKLLLNKGANVNTKVAEYDSQTALQAAAAGGYFDIVKLLLDKGAPVNVSPAYMGGRTALQAAAQSGKSDVAKLLLDRGADINASPADYGGRTALQAAAEGGYIGMVRLLLDRKANINASPAPMNGRTALQAAAENGHVAVVKFLLDRGADVNAAAAMVNGRTALRAAAEKGGHAEVVRLLLRSGASLNASDWRGNQVVLQLLKKNGHIDLVKALSHSGIDIEMEDAA